MADAELKVRIDAEIGNFSSNLKKGEQDLSKFSDKVNADLKKTAQNAAAVSAQLGGSIAKGANQAGFALQNLGRVAQDAPFGFIGIQNNLTPLLESFQRLKSETGSTGGALKALGGSLLGAGGLGFALSAISAGILLYQQYQQRANKTVQDAKKSTDEYANSLGQVQRAQLVGAQSAAQETTTLNLLFKQYTNGQLTLEKRKSAYEELQRLYPAYFGNIKFEQEASTKTKDAYDRLTTSIIATARARAAGDLITKNSQRQLENEQKIIDLGIELSKQKAAADKARAISLASIGAAGQEGTGSITATNNEVKALKQVQAIQSQINNLKTDSNILTNNNLQLEKSINLEIEKGAKLSGSVGGSGDKAASVLKTVDDQRFAREKQISIERLNSLDTFLAKYRATEAELGKTPLIGFPKDINMRLAAPLDNLKNNLLPQLQSSFQTFFDDILMRGKLSFASLGKSILNTFASVLSNQVTSGLVNLLGGVGGGTAKGGKGGGLLGGIVGLLGIGGKGGAAAAGGTAATGGALLPILAGVAAVAGIASLFKKKKDVPLPAQTTQISTQASGSTYSDFSSGRVVFEISGTNLIGVLNRAGAKLQRFGP